MKRTKRKKNFSFIRLNAYSESHVTFIRMKLFIHKIVFELNIYFNFGIKGQTMCLYLRSNSKNFLSVKQKIYSTSI